MVITVYVGKQDQVHKHLASFQTFERIARSWHILGLMSLPIVVASKPIIYDEYGFHGNLCSAIKSEKITDYILDNAVPDLTGLVSILAALALSILYCTLSTEMKQLSHQMFCHHIS